MSEVIPFNNDLNRTFGSAIDELITIVDNTLALSKQELFLRFYPFMEQKAICEPVTQLWIERVKDLRGDLILVKKDSVRIIKESRNLVEVFLSSSRLNPTTENLLFRRPTLVFDDGVVTMNLVKVYSDNVSWWALSDFYIDFSSQWTDAVKELFMRNSSGSQSEKHYFFEEFQNQFQTGDADE